MNIDVKQKIKDSVCKINNNIILTVVDGATVNIIFTITYNPSSTVTMNAIEEFLCCV